MEGKEEKLIRQMNKRQEYGLMETGLHSSLKAIKKTAEMHSSYDRIGRKVLKLLSKILNMLLIGNEMKAA